jgi:hypothetical protein
MPAAPGTRQRQRRELGRRDNPEELVEFKVRVPHRLRVKAHAAAALLNVSTAALLEQLLEDMPMPAPTEDPLPLAESA